MAARKNVSSRSPQLQPAATEMVPATMLTVAPLDESTFARRAANEIAVEVSAPTNARKSCSDRMMTRVEFCRRHERGPRALEGDSDAG
jgi:hypothetical protein